MIACVEDEYVCGWLDCPEHGRPDDGGPVPDPCTPDVGDGWKVSVVRLSEHVFKTVFSSGNRHFVLADFDGHEALAHCKHIRDSFLGALADVVFAAPPTTRGGIINRRAYVGSQLVQLRARVAELEKTARKTPPKTLVTERTRVQRAKTALADAQAALPRLEAEHARLCALETSLDVMAPIAAEARAATESSPDFRALLRRAICDFVEPLILSHLTAGTEWRDAANAFVLECAPLVFGPGETPFGVKRLPDGEPFLDRRTIEYLSKNFRCHACGEMMDNHVVVTRHARGACDETFTGPPLRAYLGEDDADQGRADLPRSVDGAAEDDEAPEEAEGSPGSQGGSGERADEADVPRVRPLTDDRARHCGDDGDGCRAPDACVCGCADCIVARDVARESAPRIAESVQPRTETLREKGARSERASTDSHSSRVSPEEWATLRAAEKVASDAETHLANLRERFDLTVTEDPMAMLMREDPARFDALIGENRSTEAAVCEHRGSDNAQLRYIAGLARVERILWCVECGAFAVQPYGEPIRWRLPQRRESRESTSDPQAGVTHCSQCAAPFDVNQVPTSPTEGCIECRLRIDLQSKAESERRQMSANAALYEEKERLKSEHDTLLGALNTKERERRTHRDFMQEWADAYARGEPATVRDERLWDACTRELMMRVPLFPGGPIGRRKVLVVGDAVQIANGGRGFIVGGPFFRVQKDEGGDPTFEESLNLRTAERAGEKTNG